MCSLRWLLALVLLASTCGAFVVEPISGQESPATKPAKSQKPKPRYVARIRWVNETKEPLPTGLTHHTLKSKAAGQAVGFCIYLPPGYESSKQRYPVIYNLHGNGGNEFTGLEEVRVLHNGIVAGKWPPMIMVLPNGGHSTFYKDSFDGRLPIETMFIRELIPLIDSEYRTIAARHGRCIEGFSMGGRGSTRLAMKYPEIFCSLFCQAGNVPRTSEHYDPERPDAYPNNYLGPHRENYLNNDAFVLLQRNLAQIHGKLRIKIACGTLDGSHLPTVRDFHRELVKQRVDHTYIELEGLGHQRIKMIERLKPIWYDYHVESLRLAAEQHRESS